MIELLVVMAIIGVLTALVVMVAGGARATARMRKAETQIKAIEEALESYKEKYGTYPRPRGGSDNPKVQAQMLYQAVTGDGTNNIDGVQPSGSIGEPGKDGEFFLEAALPGGSKTGAGLVDDKEYYLKDPWGNPYNYVRGDENTDTVNKTTFDLWSYGLDRTKSDEDKWAKNW